MIAIIKAQIHSVSIMYIECQAAYQFYLLSGLRFAIYIDVMLIISDAAAV